MSTVVDPIIVVARWQVRSGPVDGMLALVSVARRPRCTRGTRDRFEARPPDQQAAE